MWRLRWLHRCRALSAHIESYQTDVRKQVLSFYGTLKTARGKDNGWSGDCNVASSSSSLPPDGFFDPRRCAAVAGGLRSNNGGRRDCKLDLLMAGFINIESLCALLWGPGVALSARQTEKAVFPLPV